MSSLHIKNNAKLKIRGDSKLRIDPTMSTGIGTMVIGSTFIIS